MAINHIPCSIRKIVCKIRKAACNYADSAIQDYGLGWLCLDPSSQ